jgi:glycosyltransferase involved in cell wall biosynthesis
MDHFRYGRISRADIKKFNIDQFKVYKEFESPVPKSGVVLGWGTNPEEKFKYQKIPQDIQLIKAGGTTSKEFYQFCDVLCSQNDTFENLPRVGFEAMASGSVLVVDNRGGWKIQVENKVTGFLCDNTQEFINSMTFLANNKDQKEEMRLKAKEKLEREWGFEKSAKSWESVFNEMEKFVK